MPRSKPVTINDVTYLSVTEAANSLGIARNTLVSRLKKDPNPDLTPSRQGITLAGTHYATISEAANDLGINRSTLYSRVQNNWDAKRAAQNKSFQRNLKSVTVHEMTFPSVTEMLTHFGVQQTEYHGWLREGFSPCEAVSILLGKKAKKCA